ncbi:probable WRKY transcription factor 45 isoform X1 [Ricinus communis]|uniref:probable WRKY transcription factor 45 isoform X1 n=1 Tax=Ricinus communis TaxID=3988 RepID=UPI00077256C6|nr:probable WRKY transcription factor 45 isoform X1 [Ricinus communis]|eukprot:XP_015577401.1 probable WRKY transcription factor 45 [Ricinus communis]
MSEVSPASSRDPSMENEEENREEEDVDRGGHRLVLPEDGYEWRKYGQKFIKNIGKFRSYFKCQKQNCNAKKRVEWRSSNPDNIRVVYDGVHTHNASSQSANQYNLLTQVLGDQPTSQ